MRLPSAGEYIQIIGEKTEDLPILHNYKFSFEDNGQTPFYRKSRKAIIFKAEHNAKAYAIRFFLNDDPEFFKRYQQIEDYLKPLSFSWKVPFTFSGEGYNPMVKMDWLDSLSFTEFLDLIINDPSQIDKLQSKLISLHGELEGNGIAHGNLNMKHIRFVKHALDYDLKLIDYDTLFIRPFKDEDSFTTGMPGFQHPMRLASDFSETIDRFSFWIFLTALEAFKTNPSLWQNAKQNGFNKEEQILFTYRDLASPKQSEIFKSLNQYQNNALKFYTEKLLEFCSSPTLENIEAPRLYNGESFSAGTSKSIYVQKETPKITVEKKIVSPSTGVVSKTIAVNKDVPVPTVEKSQKEINKPIFKEPEIKERSFSQERIKRKRPVATYTIIILLVVLVAGYFVWANYSRKNDNTVTLNNQTPLQAPQATEQMSFFTSTNISQFLFQLYQSYNKRDLPAILGNYSNNLNRYYDAGAVTKNQLNKIVRDLFIKPVHYECNPDLTTLQYNAKGDSCKITVAVKETIQTNKRAKTENYSSKIEYIVDKTFKIRSEKNVE